MKPLNTLGKIYSGVSRSHLKCIKDISRGLLVLASKPYFQARHDGSGLQCQLLERQRLGGSHFKTNLSKKFSETPFQQNKPGMVAHLSSQLQQSHRELDSGLRQAQGRKWDFIYKITKEKKQKKGMGSRLGMWLK
jgi:hypothetical protein